MEFGYWIDLFKLGEGALGSGDESVWIQAIPKGTYSHPVYGDMNFDDEKLMEFATNVVNNVRDQELPIDYDHRTDDIAAGWVKDAQARSDGLWIKVDWTKAARQRIKEKEYRYFSPTFKDAWEHPKHKVTYKNVLFGGALTNMPYLKGIKPVNASEIESGNEVIESGGINMDEAVRKALAKIAGLGEDATEDQIQGALRPPTPTTTTAVVAPTAPTVPAVVAPVVTASEPSAAAVTAERQKRVDAAARLAEQNEVLTKRLAELQQQNEYHEQALRTAEVGARLSALNSGPTRRLAPAVIDQAREVLTRAPAELSEKIYDLLLKITETGLVDLSELGTSETSGGDVIKRFNDKVENLVRNDKLSYAEAVERIAMTDPGLYQDYRDSSYSFRA